MLPSVHTVYWNLYLIYKYDLIIHTHVHTCYASTSSKAINKLHQHAASKGDLLWVEFEVWSNTRLISADWLPWYFMVLYLDLIAFADIFSVTFIMALLYFLIIKQFQHKIRFSGLNEAAWSNLARTKMYLPWRFYSFALVHFLLFFAKLPAAHALYLVFFHTGVSAAWC